jgi:hypothetical protein
MKECFQHKEFRGDALALVESAVAIVDDYAAQGYDLSVRQLYYQLVSKNVVENTEKSYKRVCGLISDARRAGLIDWSMIRDRGRHTAWASHWDSPQQIVEACAQQFQIEKWKRQRWHIEIMVEKAALEGVLEPLCRQLDVRFTANRGYASDSLLYDVAKRIEKAVRQDGKRAVVLYLGDHDPSGLDMTRDIEDRLSLFSCLDATLSLDVRRLALNKNQIEHYNPPPNPAKTTDSRFTSYVAEHGEESWELDALEPTVLADIVRVAVAELRDDHLWEIAEIEQEKMRRKLRNAAKSMMIENPQ